MGSTRELSAEVVARAAARSTRASAKLEGRVVAVTTPSAAAALLDVEERDALVPAAAEAIGDPVNAVAVYELEQAREAEIREDLVQRVAAGDLALGDLLTDWTLRDLHARLYGRIWA